MIAPMPISHDAHQAPKMPAMIASIISQIAAPVLLTHFETLAANKPIISIARPHQNATRAYTGYQIKAKIPSIATPPTIIRITLPIKANAKPILLPEDLVEVSDKTTHLQKTKAQTDCKKILPLKIEAIKTLKVCDCTKKRTALFIIELIEKNNRRNEVFLKTASSHCPIVDFACRFKIHNFLLSRV
jgi:hypothetical protein